MPGFFLGKETMNYIIIGLIIGGIIGIPKGQASEMLVQNSTKYGIKNGIACGIGASFAYLFFAGVDGIIVSLLAKYIVKAEPVLGYVIAVIFIAIGTVGVIRKENDFDVDNSNESNFMNAMNGLMIGMTNEFAIVAIIYLDILFGVGKITLVQGLKLAGCTAVGALCWWFAIAIISNIINKIKTIKSVKYYNGFANIFVVAVGIAIILYKIMERVK